MYILLYIYACKCFAPKKQVFLFLGSWDRASWAKYEDRETNKMQQLYVYY